MDQVRIVYFDIETVYETTDYDNYDKKEIRAKRYCNDIQTTEKKAYFEKAALYPEFAKIVCISVGMYDKEGKMNTTSFYDADNEANIIKQFYNMLERTEVPGSRVMLCGHNIKTFDASFLYRRSIINGIKPNHLLDIGGKKPRDIKWMIDTLEIWRCGFFVSAGLELITKCLNLPSPKRDMDGGDVSDVFYSHISFEFAEEKEQAKQTAKDRITMYCEADVRAVAEVYRRIQDPTIVNASTEGDEPPF